MSIIPQRRSAVRAAFKTISRPPAAASIFFNRPVSNARTGIAGEERLVPAGPVHELKYRRMRSTAHKAQERNRIESDTPAQHAWVRNVLAVTQSPLQPHQYVDETAKHDMMLRTG